MNHYKMVTNPHYGKKFESGSNIEIRTQKLKQVLKSILCIVGTVPCAFFVFFLSNPGAGILLH